MIISKRLETIISLVPKSRNACDIGCDHAYVAIDLVRKNIVDKIYAVDVNKGPLAIADKNVKASGFNKRVKLLLSDGLKNVEEGCDCIIIAGMGGALIERIFNDSIAKVLKANSLVLSPQSEEEKVRKKIYEMGFFIDEELILSDMGKDYFIVRAKKGEKNYNYDYKYSEFLIGSGNSAYHDYIVKKIVKLKEILVDVPEERRRTLNKEISEMEVIADEIKRNSVKV